MKQLKLGALWLTLALALAGCVGGFQPSQPAADAKAEIEQQLDRFTRALTEGRDDAYNQSLAPTVALTHQVGATPARTDDLPRDMLIAFFDQLGEGINSLLASAVQSGGTSISGNSATLIGHYGSLTISLELQRLDGRWYITGIHIHFEPGAPGDPGDVDDPLDPGGPSDPPGPADPKPDPPGPSISIEQGWIRAGSALFQTPYYVIESSEPGPTLMVLGGVHGDEIAGWRAAERLVAEYRPDRGRLVVVPRANAAAVEANRRGAPDLSDLNRRFPTGQAPVGATANDIWNLILQVQPDWFLDLHEGYDFHNLNPNSVGQTVIVWPTGRSVSDAQALVNHFNSMPAVQLKRTQPFTMLRYPIAGSVARKVGSDLGIPAAIIETTGKDHIDRRIGFHLHAVQFIASRIGMTLQREGVGTMAMEAAAVR